MSPRSLRMRTLSDHPGWKPLVFVLAGSYQEFRYAQMHGFVPMHAIHIRGEHHLMGYERGTAQLVKYGTWDERPYKDIAPILDVCRSRHMQEVPALETPPYWD